jgi:hypothetical protein
MGDARLGEVMTIGDAHTLANKLGEQRRSKQIQEHKQDPPLFLRGRKISHRFAGTLFSCFLLHSVTPGGYMNQRLITATVTNCAGVKVSGEYY